MKPVLCERNYLHFYCMLLHQSKKLFKYLTRLGYSESVLDPNARLCIFQTDLNSCVFSVGGANLRARKT